MKCVKGKDWPPLDLSWESFQLVSLYIRVDVSNHCRVIKMEDLGIPIEEKRSKLRYWLVRSVIINMNLNDIFSASAEYGW